MGEDKAIVIFRISRNNQYENADIEIPLHITANDLVIALNEAYHLNIDITDIKNCYLKAELPFALLRGKKTLEEFGVRNGTIISFTE